VTGCDNMAVFPCCPFEHQRDLRSCAMVKIFSHLFPVSEVRENFSVLHVLFEALDGSRFSLKRLGCPFLSTDTNTSYSTIAGACT